MAAEIGVAVALILAGLVAVLSALGAAIAATALDRLHFLGPAGIAAALVAVALWIDAGPSLISVKASLLALIVIGGSPVLAHVIARSARIGARGDWRWQREDGEIERR